MSNYCSFVSIRIDRDSKVQRTNSLKTVKVCR